ncbi:AMP-binding protein [Dactylosporangium matsuzakiense]|uniref:Amino acid adenylation protein n=1 Tax=Dactylosporangium matsuzakiense TaxID=53360 RepID=A0A9W6NP74_9ACTN|nr:AMP-binding protein [Dactylosporangium matsuzakiense]UWZ42818.1 AMP-binding protein [Dactylosporangium matsuzakiense]GLL04750.1 amino acid adenylation protein [Dactylosporangium matsuzakiense]
MTDRTLYDWFLASAEANPHGVALDVGGTELTYTELKAAVEQMSARMHQVLGHNPGRVGLLTSRSLVSYIAYLAAQRLGAASVPLNPAAPAVRMVTVTETAGLDLTVVDDTSGAGLAEYRETSGIPVLDLTGDRWLPLLDRGADVPVPPRVVRGADDIAYIIFTSGTTGRPKGVPTTHGNVSSFITDIVVRGQVGPNSRVGQTMEISFDGSILEIFSAWGAGAALCVAQQSETYTPVRFINDKRLTHWMSVPSLISFATRLRALPPGSMPTLLHGMFGGESLTVAQAEAWAAAAPNGSVYHGYGPTETTVIMTLYRLPRDRADWPVTSTGALPIGHPFPHLEYVLLDDNLLPGTDGELCVRGGQRFPGYLDATENRGRFVSYEPGGRATLYDGSEPLTAAHWYRTGDRIRVEDGELVHLGRIDGQVKIRGNRVELGEIESTLRRHPAVGDVVVVTVKAADGEVDLHTVYTGTPVPDADFHHLLAELPLYMRPRAFHHRGVIPLTTSGKVDRRRLADDLVTAAAG